MFEYSQKITEYKISKKDFTDEIDIDKIGRHNIDENFFVEVVSETKDWLDLMKTLFDFDKIK